MNPTLQALRAAEARRLAELPDEALITRREYATLLGVHRNTLANLDRKGLLPPAVRLGPNGHARYRMRDVRAFL